MNSSRPRQDPAYSPHADVSGLLRHLDACVSPAHAVDYCATQLRLAGFQERSFTELGSTPPNCGFIADAGLLLAWANSSEDFSHFRIVGAHTDSPCLKIKPLPDAGNFGWRQLGVEIYGGILSNSWLDRDLGLAGRVVLSDHSVALIRIDEAVARIPQLAIHLDRDVNERGLILDKQIHLMPIWGLGDSTEGYFKEWLSSKIGINSSQITGWDLGLYDLTPASVLGSDSSLIASGRLDNQVSCWAAIEGLIAVYEASREAFQGRTAMNLPGLNVTVAQMLEALEAVAGPEVRARVRFERNEQIAGIVANWSQGATAQRAAHCHVEQKVLWVVERPVVWGRVGRFVVSVVDPAIDADLDFSWRPSHVIGVETRTCTWQRLFFRRPITSMRVLKM